MIDFEKIDSLTWEEALFMKEFPEFAKCAQMVAELIRKTYDFQGKECIEIFSYEEDREILTSTFVWKARYKNWSYEVECTEEGIFRFYKEMFFFRNRHNKKDFIEVAYKQFKIFIARTNYMNY